MFRLRAGALLLPSLERIGEHALAGRTLLHREDGAAVVVVDDRNVEPTALLEQLQIAILVGGHVRQADQLKGGGDLDR
jgi:hypothetical protein